MKEDNTDNTTNSLVVSTDPCGGQIVTASENGRETTETEDDKRRQQSSHKKRSKNWTRQETLRLIRLRSELEPRFARSGRKSELWDEISVALQGENICRDAQQCRDKWEKLTAGYKEVRDGLKSRHDNPFFDDLHPLLSARGKKENVTDAAALVVPPPLPAVQKNPIANGNDDDDDGERTEEEEDADAAAPSAKRRCHYLTAAEVDEILENLFVRQQSFFRELLDSMERKEQIREQIRQEKEDRWRAEERAQRCTLNNAMLLLTRKLLQQQSTAEAPPGTQAAAIARTGSNPKKRSKNWKRAEVLRLIKFRGEMEARFVRSSRRAALWDEVAELLAREGIRRDGKQCREKWDKLVAEYKEVAEGKREQRDSPYFAELTAILRPPADVAPHQQDQQMDIL